MSNRPTPEEALRDVVAQGGTYLGDRGVRNVLVALRHHGYRIVHPDDVPSGHVSSLRSPGDFDRGWNACRARVFGEET